VSAAFAGLIVVAEVVIRALSGSPAERREQIAEAATTVAHWKPNAVVVAVVAAGALLAIYVIGVASRSLAFAATVALLNVVNPMTESVARWWHGGDTSGGDDDPEGRRKVPAIHQALDAMAADLDNLARQVRAGYRARRGLPREVGPRAHRRWIRVVKDVGRSLLAPIIPPVTRTDDLLEHLERSYGADTVNQVLERHPVKVRLIAKPWRSANRPAVRRASYAVYDATDYCQLWLQRYARDVAVPARASRFLVLGTVAVPAILLPATLRLIGADIDVIQSLLGWEWLLWLGAIVLFFGVAREGSSYAVETLKRFVLVELAEAARGGTRRDETGSA
jgi:hypothetical protein